MSLKKTSVQLDQDVINALADLYPEVTLSEMVRLALEYVLATMPDVVETKQHLEARKDGAR